MGEGGEVFEYRGRAVVDHAGRDLGMLEDVVPDPDVAGWVWGGVALPGRHRRRALVPLMDAAPFGAAVRVACARDLAEHAPGAGAAALASPDRRSALCRHYGLADAG